MSESLIAVKVNKKLRAPYMVCAHHGNDSAENQVEENKM